MNEYETSYQFFECAILKNNWKYNEFTGEMDWSYRFCMLSKLACNLKPYMFVEDTKAKSVLDKLSRLERETVSAHVLFVSMATHGVRCESPQANILDFLMMYLNYLLSLSNA